MPLITPEPRKLQTASFGCLSLHCARTSSRIRELGELIKQVLWFVHLRFGKGLLEENLAEEPKVTKGTKDPEKGRPKSRAEKRSERKAKAQKSFWPGESMRDGREREREGARERQEQNYKGGRPHSQPSTQTRFVHHRDPFTLRCTESFAACRSRRHVGAAAIKQIRLRSSTPCLAMCVLGENISEPCPGALLASGHATHKH